MRKVMVVNETDLTMEKLGSVIDQITRDAEIDTMYYGKVDGYRFVTTNPAGIRKGYRLEITYLKQYIEWRFMENDKMDKKK